MIVRSPFEERLEVFALNEIVSSGLISVSCISIPSLFASDYLVAPSPVT